LCVLDYVEIPDLASVACVCKTWSRIVKHGYVWFNRPFSYIKKEEGKFFFFAQSIKARFYIELSERHPKPVKKLLKRCIVEAKKGPKR